jgi:HSP20 family protein
VGTREIMSRKRHQKFYDAIFIEGPEKFLSAGQQPLPHCLVASMPASGKRKGILARDGIQDLTMEASTLSKHPDNERRIAMLSQSRFPGDLFAELDRIQREMQQAFSSDPSIRGVGRGGFPAMNVGSTPESVELYAFAPGLETESIEVHLERGVLTVSGERPDQTTGHGGGERPTVHINERFAGRFRKVVSLPEDVDPDGVSAQYRDGVLHISVRRRQQVQPRRIHVQ